MIISKQGGRLKLRKMAHRRYRVIPSITIIVFITTLLILCNFPLVVRLFNVSDYTKQSVEVVKEGYDGLFAIIPKVTVSYTYKGTNYEEFFLDYNKWLFFGDDFNYVYVNKSSPSSILFIHSFWSSYVNIIFLLVILVCVVIIINNIRRFISQHGRERFTRKVFREARKIVKQERAEKKARGGETQ